jgi:6-pyruvoyltetrahydropterin/6-carboxytetrahydropterin synthase
MPPLRSSLLRVFEFTAVHHYGRTDRSQEWNRRRFGDHLRPHEHRFRVEVQVSGSLDPETGFVVDLPALDRGLRELLGPLHGSDLNQSIDEVREGKMQPSTEALAGWVWRRLAPRLPPAVRLERVRVWEDSSLGGQVERP